MEVVKDMTAHQALLLEMLKDFDAVCRKHGIRYQLFAGTALGAVRHHGFIPWDDDIQIIVPRNKTMVALFATMVLFLGTMIWMSS